MKRRAFVAKTMVAGAGMLLAPSILLAADNGQKAMLAEIAEAADQIRHGLFQSTVERLEGWPRWLKVSSQFRFFKNGIDVGDGDLRSFTIHVKDQALVISKIGAKISVFNANGQIWKSTQGAQIETLALASNRASIGQHQGIELNEHDILIMLRGTAKIGELNVRENQLATRVSGKIGCSDDAISLVISG